MRQLPQVQKAVPIQGNVVHLYSPFVLLAQLTLHIYSFKPEISYLTKTVTEWGQKLDSYLPLKWRESPGSGNFLRWFSGRCSFCLTGFRDSVKVLVYSQAHK